ncbi:MAG: phosphonoacetaldehyde reductase [Spirochaetales bacterium]|nr:phosphonoacetaldehyde reductase [Spirochaetales bacterium]
MKKQVIFHGNNCSDDLQRIIEKLKAKRIFLVTGNRSFIESGAGSLFNTLLKDKEVCRFSGFQVNPNVADVKKGIRIINGFRPDIIIAVGGGTVIDMAKSINILHNQEGAPEEYIRKEKTPKAPDDGALSFLAIPTTSGSGSESTHFAVVYIEKSKYSLTHQSLLPDYVFLDPSFTANLSPHITACTGMDALCQGIESFWSVNSTEESREYSKSAIRLALDNLEGAVNNPGRENRANMALAANFAGRAINISKTTAPHALSYYLTSYYNVPHGHAVGLTMRKIIGWNLDIEDKVVIDPRGREYVKRISDALTYLLNVADAAQAEKKITDLMVSIGLETELKTIGLTTDEDKNSFINSVNSERLANNPVQLSHESLMKIFD